MPGLIVTPDLLGRINRWSAAGNVARATVIAGLDGNAFGVEIETFGGASAVKFKSPTFRAKNRLLGLTAADLDHLPAALDFYRRDGLRCAMQFTPPMTPAAARRFAAEDVFVMGMAGALACPADVPVPGRPSPFVIREIGPDRLDEFVELYLRANEIRPHRIDDVRRFERLENALPTYRLFAAYCDDVPAGLASMDIRDGVGALVAAATLPAFRGLGCQRALIAARIAEAKAAGCGLVFGNAADGSISERNLRRAGLERVHFAFALDDCRGV